MKKAAAHDHSPAPQPRAPGLVRNVAVVGPAGSGKTTLVEALLARTGAIPRPGRVELGSTTCDSDPVEVRQQRSVALALAPVEHQGVKVNLLDTPGTPDFLGDVRAGLRAADAVLFVVSAAAGVDALTTSLWEECAAVGMPRAVVVSQLDRARADFDEAVSVSRRVFGDGVQPLYLPMHADDESVAGLIGLLSRRVFDWSSGERAERDPDPEHLALVDTARNSLIEGIVAESEDEELMDRYLAGEPIDEALLVRDLERAVARGTFFPVLAVSALSMLGTDELLEVLTKAFPTPYEHPSPTVSRIDGSPAEPIGCDPDGPLVAEVVQTKSDPYLGRISLVRVFSGTLRPDMAVHISGHPEAGRGRTDHDVDERVGPLWTPLGARLRQVSHCPAGDLCAVTHLTSPEAGDTLSAPGTPLVVQPWSLPEPQLPVALEAAGPADEERLATAVHLLTGEDPAVRFERSSGTGQLLMWCVGDVHAEVLLDRLRTRHGVTVGTPEVVLALRETLAGAVTATGRQVKQSGGHGQYAVVVLELSPRPAGSGVTFESRVVGGAVPTAYIGSVEKGVRAQLTRGVRAGRPLVDVHVALVDGKAHSVDSSDAAFQAAGALAVREAVAAAGVRVLEPVAEVEVTVPSAFVGTVMSDLAGRRGHVTGNEAWSDPERPLDRTVIRAEVPESSLLRYATELRRLTHGTGTWTRRYLRHEPMPPELVP